MDDLLIGYALKALPPDETAAVERLLATDPTAETKLARLRGLLEPLAADADPLPPPGLAVAAIARVAEHVVANKLPLEDAPAEPTAADPDSVDFVDLPPVRRALPTRRWVELGVTAAIALLAVGLLTTGILKARHENALAACKKQMMDLHAGLTGYADDHDDQFPRVGRDTFPKTGVFLTELSKVGPPPAVCPAGPTAADPTRAAYVYTLGYQDDRKQVVGLRRHMAGVSAEVVPLLADLPSVAVSPHDGPTSPHGRGQNILYTDGHVRYSLLATVGPNGDDIYRNDEGRVRAGLHPLDASLGRATDVP